LNECIGISDDVDPVWVSFLGVDYEVDGPINIIERSLNLLF
jgi:hypothetical protein